MCLSVMSPHHHYSFLKQFCQWCLEFFKFPVHIMGEGFILFGPTRWMRCSLYNLFGYVSLSSATLALLVEIKNPGRKGSKLPLWHMEDSDLGVNPTWTDFQEFCH